MKLFEVKGDVDGNVPPGIVIFPNQDPPGIELGPAREKVLQLAPAHIKKLEAAIKRGYIPADAGIPLVRADIVGITTPSAQPEAPEEIILRLAKEKDPRDRRALVNVRVAAGVNGQTRFAANVYDEQMVQDRVERVYRPFGTALGIKVIECVETEGVPWPDMLIEMEPGSSFRVQRSGALDGRPPEFLVTWNGYKLRTIVPARYKHD